MLPPEYSYGPYLCGKSKCALLSLRKKCTVVGKTEWACRLPKPHGDFCIQNRGPLSGGAKASPSSFSPESLWHRRAWTLGKRTPLLQDTTVALWDSSWIPVPQYWRGNSARNPDISHACGLPTCPSKPSLMETAQNSTFKAQTGAGWGSEDPRRTPGLCGAGWENPELVCLLCACCCWEIEAYGKKEIHRGPLVTQWPIQAAKEPRCLGHKVCRKIKLVSQ